MTDQLANERTFLAYLRTALACIGFGFVVARFGLFVRELAATTGMPEQGIAVSAPLGVVLIAAGIAIAAFGGYRYVVVYRAIERGDKSQLSIGAAIASVIILCVIGLVTAFVIYRA